MVRVVVAVAGFIGLVLGIDFLSKKHATKSVASSSSSPLPKPVTPPPVVTSSSSGSGAPSDDVYFTRPEDVILESHGYVSFRGKKITAVPVIDKTTGLFARIHYDDQAHAAELLGGVPLTEDEVLEIHLAAHDGSGEAIELEPVELVHTAEDAKHMQSRATAEAHDAEVRKQLHDRGWPDTTGAVPVSNIGKAWLEGGFNFGWWNKNGNIIQPKSGAHIGPDGHDRWIDYSQLTMLRQKEEAIA